jgi:hypothetical protein
VEPDYRLLKAYCNTHTRSVRRQLGLRNNEEGELKEGLAGLLEWNFYAQRQPLDVDNLVSPGLP